MQPVTSQKRPGKALLVNSTPTQYHVYEHIHQAKLLGKLFI